MDSVLPPRTQTQCLPPALPQKDFGHHLAGLCPKQEHPDSGRNTKHVCFAYPRAPALVWSHQPHAGWKNPQGHAVWRTCTDSRPAGRPVPHFKDICKQDLKVGNINPTVWEAVAPDNSIWRPVVKAGIQMSEQKREDQWEVRRDCRWQHQQPQSQVQTTPAINATELVTPGLGCIVTAGAATQPQTNPWHIFHCLLRQKDANNNDLPFKPQ